MNGRGLSMLWLYYLQCAASSAVTKVNVILGSEEEKGGSVDTGRRISCVGIRHLYTVLGSPLPRILVTKTLSGDLYVQ